MKVGGSCGNTTFLHFEGSQFRESVFLALIGLRVVLDGLDTVVNVINAVKHMRAGVYIAGEGDKLAATDLLALRFDILSRDDSRAKKCSS